MAGILDNPVGANPVLQVDPNANTFHAVGPGGILGQMGGIPEFALRVKDVAAPLSTPPFQGKVSIGQVYDAYGYKYPDAGSLASFKQRLVAAGKSRLLELQRLDMPERMDKELRLRSEAQWGDDTVHFIRNDNR